MAKTLYWVGSTSPVWTYGRILNWGDEIDASLVNDDDNRWVKDSPLTTAKGKAAATDTDEEVTTP